MISPDLLKMLIRSRLNETVILRDKCTQHSSLMETDYTTNHCVVQGVEE